MPPSGKKRSASFIDDSDDSAVAAPSAPKKSKNTTSSTTNGSGKDDDGNPFWEVGSSLDSTVWYCKLQTDSMYFQLSNKRRVGVSQFKNMSFINIREYYEKDGKTLPGKKVSQSVWCTKITITKQRNAEFVLSQV